MANTHRGEVEIILDRPRILRYTTNSLIRMERELGYPITQLEMDNIGVETVAILFWAGLLHEHKILTLEEAADLMDYGNYEEISTKITEAIGLVFQKGSNATGGS